MKNLRNTIFNSRKKPAKITGRIVSNPGHLTYVIKTRSGRMQVDSVIPYALGVRVVAYDGLIQGFAGSEPKAVIAEV